MREIIMVGCDLHDKTMLIKVAQGRQAADKLTFPNTPPGRQALIARLQERSRSAGGAQVAFAYEASGQGFGLYDELTAAGFQCHVLAPTKMRRTSAQKKRKTDEKVHELLRIRGVGLLTALVYLTEIGDLNRFRNRRQLAAFLGLVPSSNETGERGDCKGHITRQGPSRVRRVLCQAAWSNVRGEGPEQEAYQRIVTRNPQRKKVAVVAAMRRLAIRMWHAGRKARQAVADDAAIRG